MAAVRLDDVAHPGAPPLPPARLVDLPGRGRAFVRDLPGPSDDAPVLFLLHGLGATADLNWFPSYFALGRLFRVLAMDHRGHGRGLPVHGRFRLADCADDVAAVCAALGVRSIIPVGYSMGGPIASLVWHRHRSLVEGLVFCATGRDFAGNPRERALYAAIPVALTTLRLTPASVRRAVGEQVLSRRMVDESPRAKWAVEEFRRTNPVIALQAAQALGRFTSREWIGGVDVPTSVVITEHDQLVPPVRQRKLAAAIPGATVHTVEADHGACVQAARRFVPALVAACRDVSRR